MVEAHICDRIRERRQPFMSIDTIIGIVGGAIVGLIITHVYYRIQKRRRELCWSLDSTNLIKGYSSLFEKLEIQYGGEKIENLTVSKIAFWNSGNETIDRQAVAIPLYIYAPREGTKILDAKVIKTATIGNRFTAKIVDVENEPMVFFDFDYLDGGQGAVIQVIHTGVSVAPLMLGGEVKGVKEIEYKSRRLPMVSQIQRIVVYFYGLIAIVFIGLYVYNSVFRGIPFTKDPTVWLLVISVPVAVFFFIFDIKQQRRTAKIPKELSVFEKDDIGINVRG
jgi:hypothetical protein